MFVSSLWCSPDRRAHAHPPHKEEIWDPNRRPPTLPPPGGSLVRGSSTPAPDSGSVPRWPRRMYAASPGRSNPLVRAEEGPLATDTAVRLLGRRPPRSAGPGSAPDWRPDPASLWSPRRAPPPSGRFPQRPGRHHRRLRRRHPADRRGRRHRPLIKDSLLKDLAAAARRRHRGAPPCPPQSPTDDRPAAPPHRGRPHRGRRRVPRCAPTPGSASAHAPLRSSLRPVSAPSAAGRAGSSSIPSPPGRGAVPRPIRNQEAALARRNLAFLP